MPAAEDQAEHDHHRAPRARRHHLPGDALLLDDQVRRHGPRLMQAIRAERLIENAVEHEQGITPPYGVLVRRQVVELSAPGASIGLLDSVITGGMLAFSGLSLPITVL